MTSQGYGLTLESLSDAEATFATPGLPVLTIARAEWEALGRPVDLDITFEVSPEVAP